MRNEEFLLHNLSFCVDSDSFDISMLMVLLKLDLIHSFSPPFHFGSFLNLKSLFTSYNLKAIQNICKNFPITCPHYNRRNYATH